MDLSIELEIALGLARKASKAILDLYRLEIIAEQKLGIDNFSEPVTAADRAASRIIVKGLEEAFAGDAILSEEESDDSEHRLSRQRTWIIDPIDGTAGFIKKDGDFGIQIGLAEAGKPLLGIVFLPYHNILYHAVQGRGAFRVGPEGISQHLNVSDINEFSEMTLAVTRHHASKNMDRIVQEFAFGHSVRRGSVGLKVGLIAEKVCDIYIHPSPRTKVWDTCAPEIILEEAGGLLTDLFGMRIRYDRADLQNHNGILASNGVSHEQAIAKLRPLLDEFGRAAVM